MQTFEKWRSIRNCCFDSWKWQIIRRKMKYLLKEKKKNNKKRKMKTNLFSCWKYFILHIYSLLHSKYCQLFFSLTFIVMTLYHITLSDIMKCVTSSCAIQTKMSLRFVYHFFFHPLPCAREEMQRDLGGDELRGKFRRCHLFRAWWRLWVPSVILYAELLFMLFSA